MVTKLGAAESVDEDERSSFDLILDPVLMIVACTE